jgi:hypothetical protein
MKSLSFGNFQVGIVDNPSIENKGGFEFASGMDIFSEPGVLKACNAMEEISYGSGATPSAVPLWMVDVYDTLASTYRAYVAAGSKLLESNDGATFNLFLTNSKGTIKGLGPWNTQIVYVADGYIGTVTVGQSGTANDSYYTYLSYTTANRYPVIQQGGTLKIGAGRYISSMDEALTVTPQAMKLPSDFRINCFSEHFNNLFMGTVPLSTQINNSSVFSWRGTVLSSGAALPDAAYPLQHRGMNALFSDGLRLYGFAGQNGDVLVYGGIGFELFRQIIPVKTTGSLTVNPGAVIEYDRSILFAGNTDVLPGVFQLKNGALCQAFVPAQATPGTNSSINIGFVKTSFGNTVYIGYYKAADNSYHIERTSSTGAKQNNALVKTLWHRAGTDKKKRWGGIKLNLKPLASNTSVAVSYRTDRNAGFTSAGTIDSTNQDKPLVFAAQPRSREIQYKFVYTTSTTNTPELQSYDPLFEVLNTVR